MPTEYQDSPEQKERASGPKNSPARGIRSTKRVSGYRPKAKNALYRIAAEFKRRHPKATAGDAWRHLASVAAIGGHEVVISSDPAAGILTYRPDPGRFEMRTIKRDSFDRRWRTLTDA